MRLVRTLVPLLAALPLLLARTALPRTRRRVADRPALRRARRPQERPVPRRAPRPRPYVPRHAVPPTADEAEFLARVLVRRRHHLGAVIANRVLPAGITRRGATTSARRLAEAAGDDGVLAEIVSHFDARHGDVEPAVVRHVLTEVASRFHDVAIVASREAERRAELSELAAHVLDVPSLDSDVNDLSGLMALVGHLRD